ncbi:MAG TPA: hypothetical protein VK699_01580 [Terriglobales bacterium]|nr:hypothetical protein [Terriglobales bacterium]
MGADKPYQIQQRIRNLDYAVLKCADQRFSALYQGMIPLSGIVPLRTHNIPGFKLM